MVPRVIKSTQTTVKKILLKKKMTSSKSNQVKSLIAEGFFFLSRRQRPASWHRQTFTEERLFDAQNNKTART